MVDVSSAAVLAVHRHITQTCQTDHQDALHPELSLWSIEYSSNNKTVASKACTGAYPLRSIVIDAFISIVKPSPTFPLAKISKIKYHKQQSTSGRNRKLIKTIDVEITFKKQSYH